LTRGVGILRTVSLDGFVPMSNTKSRSELGELCHHEPRRDVRLCASCAEMISRLARVAVETPVSTEANSSVDARQAEAARLYERALEINIFTVSEYRG
jgi:hypothetical protein